MSTEFRSQNVMSAHAPLIHSTEAHDSPFNPKDFTTFPPYYIEFFNLDPQIKGDFGGTVEFQIAKNGFKSGWATLVTEVSALVAADTNTPNSPALVDFAGIELIDKIVLKFDSNELQTFSGHTLRLILEGHLRDDKQDNMAILVGGNLALNQRQTRAQSTQTFRTELTNLFFGTDIHNWLPVKHFGNLLSILVTYKPLQAVCTTNNGLAATGKINKQYLKVHYSQNTPQELTDQSADINSATGTLMPYHQTEEVRQVIPANNGANPILIDFSAARSPCYYFTIELRKRTELETPWGVDYDNWLPLNTMNITGNQQTLIRDLTHDELMYEHRSRFFNGKVDDQIYFYSFSLEPAETHDQMGSQYLGALYTPRLQLVLPNYPYEVTANLTFFVSQFVQLNGQDMKKLFF